MMSMVHQAKAWAHKPDIGLLLIRVAVGMVFFAHGWVKMQNLDGTSAMFVSLGLPAFAAVFIAYLEVIGGIAMILGVFTRVAAKLFAITMLVAIFVTGGISTGYFAHEMELVLLLAALGIMLTGGGKHSLYAWE